jgi:hypothetical protein
MGGNFVASLASVTSSEESLLCWSSLVMYRMTQNMLVGNCFAYLLLELHAAESFLETEGNSYLSVPRTFITGFTRSGPYVQ